MNKDILYVLEKNKIILLIGLFICLFTLIFSNSVFTKGIKDMEMVTENKYLSLFINKKNSQIAVLDKINNNYFYTNPVGENQVDNSLNSQFVIKYDKGVREVKRNNFSDSIKFGQFEITKLKNGVRINYKINQKWEKKDYLPHLISKERMNNNILDDIDKEKRNQLLDRYILFKMVKKDEVPQVEVDIPGLRARNIKKEEIFDNYTLLPVSQKEELTQIQELQTKIEKITKTIEDKEIKDEKNIEDLRQKQKEINSKLQNIKDNIKEKKQEIIWPLLQKLANFKKNNQRLGFVNLTKKQLKPFIDKEVYLLKKTPPFIIEDLAEIAKEGGYIPEDTRKDHLSNNINPPFPNIEVFEVPIEYVLDNNNLVVKVPVEQIYYPKNIKDESGMSQTYPLRTIQLLPNFGAAGIDEEGYIFVPDGSGGLIKLNQTNLETPIYKNNIYGRDYAHDPEKTKPVMSQQIYLPVFGLKQKEKAFLGIIEQGEALARVVADIARDKNDYNNVFPEFELIHKGKMGSEQMGHINIYQEHPYQGDIKVRYAFLGKNEANYVDMAQCYRDYLKERYSFIKPDQNKEIPFFLELVGAIPKQKSIFGISQTVIHPLTNYQQAQTIIKKLLKEDIQNIHFKYSGWLKGGYQNHYYPNQVILENNLGSQGDFTNLLNFLYEKNIGFFPEVDFMNIKDSILDDFSPKKDASKLLNDSIAKVYQFDQVTGNRVEINNNYVLSPQKLIPLINDFLRDFKQYQIKGISLANIGRQVNSDFNENNFIDRPQSSDNIQNSIEKIKKTGLQTMVNGGNANVLPYVDNILNVPMKSNNHWMITKNIPFFQIVIKGLVNYSGKPINFSSDIRKSVLKTVETGAGLYFKWSYADSSEVKGTNNDNLYSLNYQEWLNKTVDIYQEVSPVLNLIQGKPIVGHREIKENVYQTVFGEKDKIIVTVNYNQKDVNINGKIIEGENFLVERSDD